MSDGDALAPVTPLFGSRDVPDASQVAGAGASATWRTTWTDADPVTDPGAAFDADEDETALAADGEAALLRRLRTRSLSEREASGFLRERGLTEGATLHVLARMRGHGYLDDAALAEQLVHSGVERKGQGRAMLVQTLAKRGLAREVIDAALDGLPDDEAERALDFARQKARTMRDLDRDTALRRLSGQLARRGFGATALSAARQALDELGRPVRRPPAGTVRFE